MRASIEFRGIRVVLLMTMGLMPLPTSIAMAEKLAVDSRQMAGGQIVRQSLPQSHSGECVGEVRPDRVLIVGGISAQGLKPMLVKAQLDKQIAAMRQYVADKKGELVLLELMRAAQAVNKSATSESTVPQPFILVQKLEAEFPITEDIDVILERLIQLGLDRFGKQVTVEASSYGRNVVVFYRISDLRSRLDRLHATCKQRLVEQWCQLESAKKSAACKTGDVLDQRFPTLSFSLVTPPIAREHGGQSQYYLNYPWQSVQLDQVELLGNMPLSLSGPIMIGTSEGNP